LDRLRLTWEGERMDVFLQQFVYNRAVPLDVRELRLDRCDGVLTRTLTYATVFGHRRAAYVVRPVGEGPFPLILYVHWYEPSSPDSHRQQFLSEAQDMARRGCSSLLVETLWSDRDWFIKRTQADDYPQAIQQVVELRQALDLLLAQPGGDPARLAFVGHDFGAMYGALLGRVDPRPSCYVLMAGAPCFSDWFLYYPRLEGVEREAFIASMKPLDPVTHVAALSPAPLLFQFANDDPHVPCERAELFFSAAVEPKTLRWYEAGHSLNAQAATERVDWLTAQLNVPL